MYTAKKNKFFIYSAASVAIAAIVVTGLYNPALAGKKNRGAGVPPFYAYGLPHTAEGAATLGLDPLGRLKIMNLGSTGKDGVRIELGTYTNRAMRILMPESGVWPANAMVCATEGDPDTDDYVHLGFDETNSGDVAVSVDYGSGVSPQCVRVQFLLNDAVVHSYAYAPPLPAALFTGNIGSASGNPVTIETSVEQDTLRLSIFCPNTGVWFMTPPGSPTPISCDRMSLSLDGLPPGKPEVGSVAAITGSNLPNDELIITGESLGVTCGDDGGGGGSGGSTNGTIQAVGAAHMTGISGPDICAGCPECCDFADPLVVASGASISNIGSSGCDGVRFACREWGSPWFVSDLELRTNPIWLSAPGMALRVHAVGTYGGMPGHDLGQTCVRVNPATGELHLFGDFTPLGSNDLTVEVHSGGVLQGSVQMTGGPGVVLGTITSPGGLAVTWYKCGKIGGPGQPPCYRMCTNDAIIFEGGGQLLIGDDLRVLATGAPQSVSSLDSLSLLGENTDPFNVYSACASDGSSAGSVLAANGLMHSSIGDSTLEYGDADGDGQPDLRISNIGSSGKDGVSIDLDHSQGVSMSINDADIADNSLTGMRFDIYDDQCVANLDMELVGPNQTSIQARRWGDCCCCHVTLLKANGEVETEFTVLDDPVMIETTPGSALRVRSVDMYLDRDGISGDTGVTVHTRVAQAGPGGVDVGVTVSHALHGTFNDISHIVFRSDPSPSAVSSVTRACMTATASVACAPCDICMTQTAVHMHGAGHAGRGEARVIAESCEFTDGTSHDALIVSNIGSSGLDGVRVNLESAIWRDPDDDNDGVLDTITGGNITLACCDGIESVDDWIVPTLGSVGGGQPVELGRVSITKSSPQLYNAACTGYAWMPSPTITIVVRDQFGNAVPNGSRAGLSLGQLCSLTTDAAVSSFEQHAHGTGGAIRSMESVSFTYAQIKWTYSPGGAEPVSFDLPGRGVVSGTSLEIYVEPSSGNPVAAQLLVQALDVIATSYSGTPAGFGINEEGVKRLASQCEADLTDAAGTGVPDGMINVFDLFQVLSNWNTAGSGAELAMPRDVVDVFDLFVLLSRWGNC